MMRLFVAIELPEAVRERLAALAGGVPGARWVEPQNLHLTLRFIGEVDEGTGQDIASALSMVGAPGFDLVLDGVGQFGTSGRPRVLWAGVEHNDSLLHLQAKVESALVRTGLAVEERRYAPHITLARLKAASPERVGRFLIDRGLFRAGPIPVDRFVLFASHTGRHGPIYTAPIYTPLCEYALDQEAAGEVVGRDVPC